MGDFTTKITVLGVEHGVRVCAQYTIACYYTEPYVVGVLKRPKSSVYIDQSYIAQYSYLGATSALLSNTIGQYRQELT